MKEVLDRARAIAREMGHATVGEAHALLALLDAPPVQARMAERGQSRVRLERRLRETLAAEWDGQTYRTAPEPTLDSGLENAIGEARGRGIRRFLRGPGVADVFEHLLARRELPADIAFDVRPVRRLFNATRSVANSLNHRNTLIDHAFLALARKRGDDARFARALEAIGHSPVAVQAALFRQLVSIGVRRSARVVPFPALVTRAAAHANSIVRESLDVDVLVVDLLRNEFARTCLGRIGIPRNDLLRAYVAGAARAEAAAESRAEPGPAEVVFHNDDFTTQEVVMRLLEDHFNKSSEDARAFMLRVHEEGSAAFEVPDTAGAARAVEAALEECAELGMPLRIELRAIPVGGKGSDRPPSF